MDLGESPFDRDEFAVRADCHVAAGQRAPGSEPGSDGGVSDQRAGRQRGNDHGACTRRSSTTATTALRTD